MIKQNKQINFCGLSVKNLLIKSYGTVYSLENFLQVDSNLRQAHRYLTRAVHKDWRQFADLPGPNIRSRTLYTSYDVDSLEVLHRRQRNNFLIRAESSPNKLIRLVIGGLPRITVWFVYTVPFLLLLLFYCFPRNSIVPTSVRHRLSHFQRFSTLPDFFLRLLVNVFHLLFQSYLFLRLQRSFFIFISALFLRTCINCWQPYVCVFLFISHFPPIGLCTTFYRLIHFCVYFVWMINK